MQIAKKGRCFLRCNTRKNAVTGVNQSNIHATPARDRCCIKTDITTPNDQCAFARLKILRHRICIVQRSDIMDVFQITTHRAWQQDRRCTCCNDQGPVPNARRICERDSFLLTVNPSTA